MLPRDQIEQIKKQLIDQIDTTFPEDKKNSAKQQIQAMDEKQLEEFLIQNNLIKSGEGQQQCVFCSIIEGKIPSYKIDENESAIAVLEINPISRGHTMIIPKPHVQEVSQETKEFAKQVSLKLKEKLSAKDTQISESEMFGHKTLSIIPIYDDKTLEGKKQPASKEELESLQKELTVKEETKPEEEKEQEIITDENTWLPKRIP